MSSDLIKYFILLSLIFPVFSSYGQTHQKELQLCKGRRLKTNEYTCTGDTAKKDFCDSLLGIYLLKKERFFIKYDSINYVISEMNKTGSKYRYYLQMGGIVYFDWGSCDSKHEGNGVTRLIHLGFYDKWDDILDFKVIIAKESKFSLTLNSGTTGKTFYREDVK